MKFSQLSIKLDLSLQLLGTLKIINLLKIIGFSILLLVIHTKAFAGAWVQKRGEGLNIITGQYYASNHYWTSGGHLRKTPLYTKIYASEYFEFGASDKLTLGFYFSGLDSHTQANGTRGGGQDSLALARYLLWKNDYTVVSTQFFADRLGQGAQVNIPPQNSKLNTGEALLIGTSGTSKDKKINWFFDTSLGLVQRYGPGNQVQIIFESGWKFNSDQFWIFIQSFNTISTGSTSLNANPQNVAYNLFTIAPSILFWPAKHLGVQFGATQDMYGQNVGEGFGPFVSTWYTF